MKVAEFEKLKPSLLKPEKWTEVYLEDGGMFMSLRFYCGDCGTWQTYGSTPYCPYCGKKKVNAEVEA